MKQLVPCAGFVAVVFLLGIAARAESPRPVPNRPNVLFLFSDALAKSGHADDTIILFSSDQGLSVGRHGLFGKQNMYEHAMRPPLVFAGPGIPKGSSDAMVYLYDLFPTVCDLTGVAAPATVEGKSLAPILRGEAPKVRDHVIGAYMNVQRMVREGRWKLIVYHVKGVTTRQLFDLDADPWEMNNRIDDPDCAERVRRLEALLAESLKAAGDPDLK
ncbi:MAG: sulfatase-like hydrolase/transferase [Planctomycetia bacterium]|nr:sulfatase-like hydrolase/transferase [Planctomycetia bacterium]